MEKVEPLFGCNACYEDSSYHASDLRIHNNEVWCEYCWDDCSNEDMPRWSELPVFVPEHEKRIAELEAEISELDAWACRLEILADDRRQRIAELEVWLERQKAKGRVDE